MNDAAQGSVPNLPISQWGGFLFGAPCLGMGIHFLTHKLHAKLHVCVILYAHRHIAVCPQCP